MNLLVDAYDPKNAHASDPLCWLSPPMPTSGGFPRTSCP
jgi:hypothetical protein